MSNSQAETTERMVQVECDGKQIMVPLRVKTNCGESALLSMDGFWPQHRCDVCGAVVGSMVECK